MFFFIYETVYSPLHLEWCKFVLIPLKNIPCALHSKTYITEFSNVTCCPQSTRLYFEFETRCLSDIGPCENISVTRARFLPLDAYFWIRSVKKKIFYYFQRIHLINGAFWMFCKGKDKHLGKCNFKVFPRLSPLANVMIYSSSFSQNCQN